MRQTYARRNFLGLAAAVATGLVAAPAIAVPRAPGRRALAFHNLHTGESLDLVYWADGRYLPDATQRIEYLLRDFRNNKVHAIDPRLLDLFDLFALAPRYAGAFPRHLWLPLARDQRDVAPGERRGRDQQPAFARSGDRYPGSRPSAGVRAQRRPCHASGRRRLLSAFGLRSCGCGTGPAVVECALADDDIQGARRNHE